MRSTGSARSSSAVLRKFVSSAPPRSSPRPRANGDGASTIDSSSGTKAAIGLWSMTKASAGKKGGRGRCDNEVGVPVEKIAGNGVDWKLGEKVTPCERRSLRISPRKDGRVSGGPSHARAAAGWRNPARKFRFKSFRVCVDRRQNRPAKLIWSFRTCPFRLLLSFVSRKIL